MVEDNVLNQKIVGFMLKKQEATVTSALNGSEAIDLLRENHFDVVLMDLHMPKMDGFATTRFIRKELQNNVPVIALTADIFVVETNDCLEAGMNGCISKPFEPEDLCRMILGLIKKTDDIKLSN